MQYSQRLMVKNIDEALTEQGVDLSKNEIDYMIDRMDDDTKHFDLDEYTYRGFTNLAKAIKKHNGNWKEALVEEYNADKQIIYELPDNEQLIVLSAEELEKLDKEKVQDFIKKWLKDEYPQDEVEDFTYDFYPEDEEIYVNVNWKIN